MSFFSLIAEHSKGSLTGLGVPQTAAALLSPTPSWMVTWWNLQHGIFQLAFCFLVSVSQNSLQLGRTVNGLPGYILCPHPLHLREYQEHPYRRPSYHQISLLSLLPWLPGQGNCCLKMAQSDDVQARGKSHTTILWREPEMSTPKNPPLGNLLLDSRRECIPWEDSLEETSRGRLFGEDTWGRLLEEDF